MKKILHIIATPRAEESRTLQVSRIFIEGLAKKYPGCEIDELNVSTGTLPALTIQMIDGKYALLSGKELSGKAKEAWKGIERSIERFLSADAYLISTPMWNFSIPYTLKQYIDIIIQPKYLFRYVAGAPEGLVKNKRMVVITSRGGDYGPASPFRAYDFQEPYLRGVFGFVGITDITFINAQPMDADPGLTKSKLEEAKSLAQKTAENF